MNDYWYLDSKNQQHGPIPPHQFASAGVTPQTLVWCNGMDTWRPAGEIPELAGYFAAGPRPQTPPPNNNYQQNNYQNNGYGIPPSSYMVWAILTTILCCLPFGIVSIIYASKVDSEWMRGNYESAYRNSRLAKNWAIASAVTSVACLILYIILIAFFGVAGGLVYL